MDKFLYSYRLADRFTRDYKMPIPVTFEAKHFGYYLGFFEKFGYDTLTKYIAMMNEIKQKHNGNIEAFLENFYDVRENIITVMHQNIAVIKFNEMDMSVFALDDKPNVSNSGIYNTTNVGKYFISIDLKKANFSSLKYVDKDIVFGAETYEGFIGKFTDSDYIKDSKHFRQVIFGQLNPKRHITVEKWLINEIRKRFDDNRVYGRLVSMVTDELIYEVVADGVIPLKSEIINYLKSFAKDIQEEFGIDISFDFFNLRGYDFILATNDKVMNQFYQKESFLNSDKRLKCVPLPYSCIAYELLYDKEPSEYSHHFTYEGTIVEFKEDFKLKEIKVCE